MDKENVKTLAGIVPQDLLRQVKERLSAAFGARLKGVVLYGSYARGEVTGDSDIDFLVLLEEPISLTKDIKTIVHALYPLHMEIVHPIHAMPVNAVDYERGEVALYRNAKQEGMRYE